MCRSAAKGADEGRCSCSRRREEEVNIDIRRSKKMEIIIEQPWSR